MAGSDLIIFDCNGVLVDSEIIAAQVEAKLLIDIGYPIKTADLAERFAGMSWKDILLTVEKEASVPIPANLLTRPKCCWTTSWVATSRVSPASPVRWRASTCRTAFAPTRRQNG